MRKYLAYLAAWAILTQPNGVWAQSLTNSTNPVTLAGCSGTITTGGTAQTAVAANTARRYLFIENPVAATETLLVDIDATAAPNTAIELAAGGSLTFSAGAVPVGAVSVRAATTAHVFICKQGFNAP